MLFDYNTTHSYYKSHNHITKIYFCQLKVHPPTLTTLGSVQTKVTYGVISDTFITYLLHVQQNLLFNLLLRVNAEAGTRGVLAQVFLNGFFEISSKNTFYYRKPLVAASVSESK